MTDKLFMYIMASQLAFSNWIQTLVPMLCGLLAGVLYRTDVGNIKRWRFPIFLQTLTKTVIDPFFMASPNPRSSATMPVQRPMTTNLGLVNRLLASELDNGNGTETEATTNRPVGRSSTVRVCCIISYSLAISYVYKYFLNRGI